MATIEFNRRKIIRSVEKTNADVIKSINALFKTDGEQPFFVGSGCFNVISTPLETVLFNSFITATCDFEPSAITSIISSFHSGGTLSKYEIQDEMAEYVEQMADVASVAKEDGFKQHYYTNGIIIGVPLEEDGKHLIDLYVIYNNIIVKEQK